MKSKVINLPARHAAVGEDDAFWFIAVSPMLGDEYTCEYDARNENWKITVKAGTFQGVEALVEKCRRILGWDGKEAENATAN